MQMFRIYRRRARIFDFDGVLLGPEHIKSRVTARR